MKRGQGTIRTDGPRINASASAIYWFAVLDQAVEEGDLSRAIEARDELKILGYTVTKTRAIAGAGRS